jgi:DDE superfamily endonuclease
MAWMEKIFEPQTCDKANSQYRILIVDGHGSHFTPEFLDYAEKHKIIVLLMPPHTSHILQPMDQVFPSVKHWFHCEVDSWLRLSKTQISKADFIRIYSKTRPKAMTIENLKSAFRKTGLNPFNPAIALRQLPIAPMSPPHPSISLEFQTPQTLHHLQASIKQA